MSSGLVKTDQRISGWTILDPGSFRNSLMSVLSVSYRDSNAEPVVDLVMYRLFLEECAGEDGPKYRPAYRNRGVTFIAEVKDVGSRSYGGHNLVCNFEHLNTALAAPHINVGSVRSII